MNRSLMRLGRLVLYAAVWLAPGLVYAQGSNTQTLSGSVVDASGAVIPGADVAAKHAGTGVVTNAVSNADGAFSMPGMQAGTYSVTVTLQGFKTVVINNVVLTSGAGASVKATMEVGGVSESDEYDGLDITQHGESGYNFEENFPGSVSTDMAAQRRESGAVETKVSHA